MNRNVRRISVHMVWWWWIVLGIKPPRIGLEGPLAGTWEKLSHTQGSYRYRGTSPIPSRRDVEEEGVRAQLCKRRGTREPAVKGHTHSVALPKEGFIWGLDFPSWSLL